MAGFVDKFKRMWDAPDDEYEYDEYGYADEGAEEDYKEEQEDFKKYVMKKDKRRSNYYNYYTTKKWGHLKNFDLTINSDLGIDEVATIIADLFLKGEK